MEPETSTSPRGNTGFSPVIRLVLVSLLYVLYVLYLWVCGWMDGWIVYSGGLPGGLYLLDTLYSGLRTVFLLLLSGVRLIRRQIEEIIACGTATETDTESGNPRREIMINHMPES